MVVHHTEGHYSCQLKHDGEFFLEAEIHLLCVVRLFVSFRGTHVVVSEREVRWNQSWSSLQTGKYVINGISTS